MEREGGVETEGTGDLGEWRQNVTSKIPILN